MCDRMCGKNSKILKLIIEICPTCHGYRFNCVSTPPTILVPLLGIPQLQFPVTETVLVGVVDVTDVVLGVAVVVDANKSFDEKSIKRLNTFIPALTSLICSHKHRTANFRKESFFSSIITRSELDRDGVGAGEGAGDGGAAVALGGHTVIDLHPVR